MMKRLLAAVFAVAVFTSMAATAWADAYGGSPHLVTERLLWRQSKINVNPVGYVDSVAFNRIGVGGATMPVANAETTTVIRTSGWTFPVGAGTVVAADSISAFNVVFSDAGATNANVDSIHVAVQVSADGTNWLYVGQVVSQIGINPITAAGPAVSSFPLANAAGTTTTTPKVFALRFNGGTASSAIIPDRYGVLRWPLLRFIVVNKTVGSYQHNLQCFVTHWSTITDQ